MEIKKDEFEFLEVCVNKEIESYEKQIDWYKEAVKFVPNRTETIKDCLDYIQRLRLLKKKLEILQEV